jgi:hypothetical protein
MGDVSMHSRMKAGVDIYDTATALLLLLGQHDGGLTARLTSLINCK